MKQRIKKLLAGITVLAVAAGAVVFSTFGINAGAASTAPTVTAFATKNQLMTVFDLDGNNDTVGLIYFGNMDYTTNIMMTWYIAGKDNGISGDNVILFAKSYLSPISYSYSISGWNWHDAAESNFYTEDNVFTSTEKSLINTTRIDSSNDRGLYSLKGTCGENTIYAGTNNNVKVHLPSYPGGECWLRTEYDSNYQLCVRSSGTTVDKEKKDVGLHMRSAVNINLTNVLFASSARTDSSAVKYEKTNASTGMILRLDGSDKKIGTVKYYDVNGYQGVAAYKDENATGAVSLVIQGNDGTNDWYYSAPVNDYTGVMVEEIESALGISGVSLDKCKIWLETTSGRVAYATGFASKVQSITTLNSVAFNIDAPVGGSALDTTAEINKSVNGFTYGTSDITWSPADTSACYNTAYTASVTVKPHIGYSFSSSVTARVNTTSSNNGTVTKNSDGTITVKYTFGKTAYGNPQASDFTFTPPSNLVYNGSAKTATVTSSARGMGAVTAIKYYKNGTRLSSAPVDVGEYTVKIDVARGNNYNSASDVTSSEWKFTISKAAPAASNFTFTPSAGLVYDGTQKSAEVKIKSGITGMGNITAVKYLKDGESTATTTVPKDAGTYSVLIDVSDGSNYASVTGLTSSNWKFTIEKAVPTSDDFIFTPPSNLVYDGSRKNARVTLKSGLSGLGGMTYRYYWVNAGYNGAVAPGPAYTYIVKISISEGENFTSATDVTSEDWTFTITRATTTVDKFTFTPPSNLVYDGTPKVATVSVNSGVSWMGDITVKYYGSDGAQLSSAPTDVGSYTVKIDVAQGGNYSAASDLCLDSWKFDITAATPSTNHFNFTPPENLVYDDSAKPAAVELKQGLSGMGSFTVKYFKDGSSEYTTEAPVSPGTYTVKLDILAGTNFTSYSNLTSAAWKYTVAPAVPTADDFTFTPPSDLIFNGSEKAATVTKKSEIKGMGEFTVKYYDKDGNLLSSAPTNPGTYTVKLDVAAGTNYTSATAISDNWVFIVSDVTESDDFTFTPPSSLVYDGTAKEATVAVKSGVTGMGRFDVNYYYADGTKLSSAPINAGSYTVKIDVEATAYYTAAQQLTATEWSFTITKATPAVDDFIFTTDENLVYDDTAKGVTVVPKANIVGIGEVTVKYYNDGEELDSAPVFPGTYTVRIDVTEGSNYTAIDDLTTLSWKYSIADIVSSTYFTFVKPTDLAYDGNGKQAAVKAKSGITGMGAITVKYYGADGEQLSSAPVLPGTYYVKIDVSAGRKYAAATDITSDGWKFTITKGNLTAEGTGKASGKYGDTLSDLAVSGLTVKFGTTVIEGEWSLTGSTIVNAGDTGRYTATFAPQENPEYYNPLTVDVELDIAKADAPEVSDASANYNWAAVGEKSVSIEGLPSDMGTLGTPDFDITDTDGILTADSARFAEGKVYFTLDTNTKANIGSTATIDVTLPTQNYSDITFKVTINIVAKKNQNAPSACELSLALQSNGTYTATISAVEGAEYKFNNGEWGTSNTLTGIEHIATVTAYIRMAETSEYNASEAVSASRILGHIYSTEWTIDKPATCTEKGSKSHHCTICGDKKDITDISMISHSYGEWIVDTSATCTTDGSKHRTCSACGKTETQVISATGHSYSTQWTIDKPATCTEKGSKSHHCTICGDKKDITDIPVISHSYGEWIVDTAATCTQDGSKHRTCSACTDVERQNIQATGHSYGEWIVDTAATCTQDGSKHRTCSACTDVERQTIQATGHSYSAQWTVDKQATCTEQGSKSHHCTICGDKKDITVIPVAEHTYVSKVIYPTYTAKGYTVHTCSVCGDSYNDAYTAKLIQPNVTGVRVVTRTDHSLVICWSAASSADGYTVEKYNGTKWVSVAEITGNKTTTCCVSDLNAATEYKLRVRAYAMSGTKKLYSSNTATVSAYTYPSRVTGIKLTARTASSLTLSWDKNASADGYIIELYQSGKWVNVTKITNKATTSYRVTGLKAGTAYRFRIRAYVKTGNSSLSSCYLNTIAVRTLPSDVTGFKLTARTSTSLTLGWDKNASAGGYVVEQYKNGKWVSIAKLSKATTTCRVTGLKAGATYKFRIKAYTMSGITKLYSGYKTISVKTAN